MSAVLFLETLIQTFFFPLKSFTVGHCFDNSLKMLEKHWSDLVSSDKYRCLNGSCVNTV